MKAETFIFSDIREEPYNRVSLGDVVVFDDYPYRSEVEIGVVTTIDVDPKNSTDALITIAHDEIATVTRRATDFHIGKMKKVRNINTIKINKEDK
jgi:hypothetical protein